MQTNEILETIKMIDEEYLDIRTITMGISLLDCIDPDIKKSCEKVENKICTLAKDLVKVGNEIEKTYGIPVVNKRISVTPIAMFTRIYPYANTNGIKPQFLHQPDVLPPAVIKITGRPGVCLDTGTPEGIVIRHGHAFLPLIPSALYLECGGGCAPEEMFRE